MVEDFLGNLIDLDLGSTVPRHFLRSFAIFSVSNMATAVQSTPYYVLFFMQMITMVVQMITMVVNLA